MTTPTRIATIPRYFSFDPKGISGLKLWLDSSTLGLSDGTLVASWTDLSGATGAAIAAGANRPTFKTNVGNGHNGVRFSSAGPTKMSTPNCSFGSFSIFYTLRSGSTDSGPGGLGEWIAGRVFSGALGHTFDAGYRQFQAAESSDAGTNRNTGQGVIRTAPNGDWMLGVPYVVFRNVFNGTPNPGTINQAINGVVQAWTPTVVGVGNPGAGVDAEPFYLGARGDSAFPFNGDIGELLVYDSVLGAANITSIESYLLSKWT